MLADYYIWPFHVDCIDELALSLRNPVRCFIAAIRFDHGSIKPRINSCLVPVQKRVNNPFLNNRALGSIRKDLSRASKLFNLKKN